MCGGKPSSTLSQTPSRPVPLAAVLHALQPVLHADSQHTPSTQFLLPVHSWSSLHDAPCALSGSQVPPDAQ